MNGANQDPENDIGQLAAFMRSTKAPPRGSRTRLMHDGQSLTFRDAILRHGGQAEIQMLLFRSLDSARRRQVLAFLGPL